MGKVFVFYFCQSSFNKRSILERHECLSYEYESCPEALSSRNDLIKHISIHTGKKTQMKPNALISTKDKPFKSYPSTFPPIKNNFVTEKFLLERRHSNVICAHQLFCQYEYWTFINGLTLENYSSMSHFLLLSPPYSH